MVISCHEHILADHFGDLRRYSSCLRYCLMLYRNGGWEVSIDEENGTKVRSLVDRSQPLPLFPESLDLKVTDFCDAGCAFCHESSTMRGKHADLLRTQMALSMLPPGVEIAIGGGNPLSWPHIDEFLEWCQTRRLFANITVNGLHMSQKAVARLRQWQDKKLVHGIGLSAVSSSVEPESFGYNPADGLRNVVGHIILGVADLTYVQDIMPAYLVLGYKEFGRGVNHKKKVSTKAVPETLRKWLCAMNKRGAQISFDNLAIEQGKVKCLIEPEAWNKLFMGPDGMFTMFVDAVKQEWAVSSTTPYSSRVSWKEENLREFFLIATTEHSIGTQDSS